MSTQRALVLEARFGTHARARRLLLTRDVLRELVADGYGVRVGDDENMPAHSAYVLDDLRVVVVSPHAKSAVQRWLESMP